MNLSVTCILLTLALGGSAFAQSSLSLSSGSAPAGGSSSMNLSLAVSGTAPAALQWTLGYGSGITSLTVAPGSSLTSAGKTVNCNTGAGSVTCVASGNNSGVIPNGPVAVVTATLATTVSGSSLPISVSGTTAVLSDGTGSTLSGAGSAISVTGVQPPLPVLSGLSCSPTSLATPGTATCTVTLSGAAPSGGLSVAVSDNSSYLSVPATVLVGSGAGSAGFTATASSCASNQTATVTASLNGASANASITLQSAGSGGTPPAGLVAAWSFNEGSGTTVADASGNGNTGQIQNATWAAGRYGSALAFNGSNALVSVADAPGLHLTTGMTLEAWVNPSRTLTSWQDVIYRANDNYFLEATSNLGYPAAGVTVGSSGPVVYGASPLPTNAWSHLAVTYDGANFRLYVNGVQVSSQSVTGSLASSTSPLQIGGDTLYQMMFSGLIDEVRVYNVALTAAQVQSDMNTPVANGGGAATQPSLSSLTCSPSTIASGGKSTCTVALSQAAPTGGTSVALSDNSAALTVPSSVTVAAGATAASFTATAGTVTSNQSVTITASLNLKTAAAPLTITAPPPSATVSTLTCSPSTLSSNASSTCTVKLSQAAPSGGSAVALADNCTVLTIPTSVTVAAGATSANFTASAGSIASNQTAVVTASLNGTSATASLALQAPVATYPASLVAAWSFNEGSGSTVADATGHGNTGTIQGATWSTSGKYGNALKFNGTSALVSVADKAALHLTTGMTLEAWVNPSTVNAAWRDVIYKGNDNYFLEATSNQTAPAGGATVGSAGITAYGASALPANTWSHLALTYDGATLRLYVNGVQVSSTSKSGSLATSTNPLQIGGDSLYGQNFAGLIDEVRVYNAALSGTQIKADMAAALK